MSTAPETTAPLGYWQSIDRALALIEETKPHSFNEVKAILDEYGNPDEASTTTADQAFFGGGGGDATLADALRAAGWRTTWCDAWYFYAMVSPTGERLTYIEGDVVRGDSRL